MIDPESGTLYVLERTKTSGLLSIIMRQHLHALAVTTGVEKFGGPVEIAASMKASGTGASFGNVGFDALRENPRAALPLADGVVVVTWASSCDVGPYHGWVMAYDARTLEQRAVINASPDGTMGGYGRAIPGRRWTRREIFRSRRGMGNSTRRGKGGIMATCGCEESTEQRAHRHSRITLRRTHQAEPTIAF